MLEIGISILITALILRLGFWIQKKIGFLHDPVYVPSTYQANSIMVKLAHPKADQVVADFGSGDGRVVEAFAHQGCMVTGYEVDPFLVWSSRRRLQKSGLSKKACVRWQSFWQADVSHCDIVILYTTASIMERLETKLQRELPKGAKVISQQFQFPHWKPQKNYQNFYVYEKN